VSEWTFAQTNPAEKLARLHFFSIIKHDVEFRITVREHADPQPGGMRFFAEADRQVNQPTAPFTPFGWGDSVYTALAACIRNIDQFPYQDPGAHK
jgi:hypothetical protein